MWTVITRPVFDAWLEEQAEDLQEKVLAALVLLRRYGPELGRPYADSIAGSTVRNLKELRIQHKGRPIRAFYAFDPVRQAVVICAGDKSNDKRFYDRMIFIAETEFRNHLTSLTE